MKKIVILVLMVLSSLFSYGKELSQINSLIMDVKESITINGEVKNSEYKLSYIYPDFIRKDILSPELNRGEVYIYTKDKKIVYLPLFDQKSEEALSGDENEALEAINFILTKDKDDSKFKEDYHAKKIKEIYLKNGRKVEIDSLKEYNGYLLPTKFIVYDGDMIIAKLQIKQYEVNSNINVQELSQLWLSL